MRFEELPPETMAEILNFLDMPHLGLLLLTGASELYRKMINGGATSLQGVVSKTRVNTSYISDGFSVSRKYIDISFTSLFASLKRLRNMTISFVSEQAMVPSWSVLQSCSESLVKLYIKSPRALEPFVTCKIPGYYEAMSNNSPYTCLANEVARFQKENPLQKLNPWVPIATLLPSLRSLHIYAPIGQFSSISNEKLFPGRMQMLIDFQLLLPPSLTVFGWNAHNGEVKSSWTACLPCWKY
jgi:hypothetical protein